jgi:Na+/H+-dicarboxylate symporter
MRKLALHWQILIAIGLAGIVGFAVNQAGDGDPSAPGIMGVSFLDMFNYVGRMFLNALRMIIVPLIMSSIIVGMAGIGASGNLGVLGGRTLLFYAGTTLAAIIVGLVLINITNPGISDGMPVRETMSLSASVEDIAAQVEGRGAGDIAEVFLRLVPENIVRAAGEGQMLGIIFFSLLFGFFMTKIKSKLAKTLFRFWDGVFHVMMMMTEWIMKFAPIGVFGLIAGVIAETGFSAATPLLIFAVTVLVALGVHVFVTLPLLLRFVGGVAPFKMFPAMAPAMLTAFSTASSAATLPITMDCIEENVGVSNRVSSFVLPLGATVNMNGTALYECAAAMFLAQAYGLELTFSVQFIIVVTALLTSIGVAGVPSASLVAIAIILAAVGLPIEALAYLMVFDRILDMARTSVNVFGDSCCAVIVARLSGEETKIAASEAT